MPAAKVPKPARKDPAPRHLDGSSVWARLRNKDPDRHYVFVNKNDPESLAYYEDAGYDPVVASDDGVKLAGGRTGAGPGQHIEMRGMLLFSVSKERHAQIELQGADGDAGQKAIDQIEARILDKRGFDPLRGIRPGLVSLIHEIGPAEVEGIP